MSTATTNIVYINYWEVPIGAADVMHTMKMCQAYQQIGHRVTLVAPQAAPTALPALWEQYGISTPFTVKLYARWKWSRRHSVFWQGVFLALRKNKPVIVHTRSSAAAFYASLAGINTIYETHRPLAKGMERFYLRAGARLKTFKRFIAVTEPVKASYAAFLPLLVDKIMVVNNGVDLSQFSSQQSSTLHRINLNLPDKFTVGYIGSLFAGRGIELIVALAQQLPDIQFLVVGGMLRDIESWRLRLDPMPPNLIFHAAVPNRDLPQYMLASDILLMPYQQSVAVFGNEMSNSVNYMNPMKMYEYMAAKRLVIASDLPMIRAVLDDDMAFLCAPDDISAWQTAIEKAYRSPNERLLRVENAYAFVQNHTWQHRASRILEGLLPKV